MRPSTKTLLPLETRLLATSANRPKQTTVNHSVSSRRSPPSAAGGPTRLQATEKFTTGLPAWVYRISGSRPTLPISVALHRAILVTPSALPPHSHVV